MTNELRDIIETRVENETLRNAAITMMDKPLWSGNIAYMPGAINYHHNYIGGLLDHVTEVVRGVLLIIDTQYSDMHQYAKDLLIVGAVLHDYGKLYRYAYNLETGEIGDSGIDDFTKYTYYGKPVAPCMYLTTRTIESTFDVYVDEISDLIDVIMMHHGKIQWGSYQNPFGRVHNHTAWILFASDYFSSRILDMRNEKDEFVTDSLDRYFEDWQHTPYHREKMQNVFELLYDNKDSIMIKY